MKIKFLTAIITTVSALAAPFSVAATYQSQLSATYADIDVIDDAEEGYFVGLEGKYYFSPVDTKTHPLAEAAFIEKVSSVYLGLGNYEFREAGERLDIYQRTLGIDFYIPSTIFYLGAGVNERKSKYSWPAEGGFDSGSNSYGWDSRWFVKAGLAPVTGLLVWTEFTEDIDVKDDWNINGKYVIPLSGEQALNIEASYEKSDIRYTDAIITGAADYYLDRHLSLGAGFVNTSFNSSYNTNSTTDYFIRARNFFTDAVSVELTYTDGDYESRLELGGSIRF